MADFLVALADFDRRRGWEVLGHASFFAFINSELGLSPAPTYWRSQAARLLQDFPELIEPLRRGLLCLTTMGELAKVLTDANKETVLPRFLGISTREAKELVAELQPRAAPPIRTVVRPLAPAALLLASTPSSSLAPLVGSVECEAAGPAGGAPTNTYPESLWAPKVELANAARVEPRRDQVDPLTAELSRLSTTVSRRFLRKLKTARAGLAQAIPGATTEQVLEAALDLLLEKQARSRGQVKRPRGLAATPASTATVATDSSASPTATDPTTTEPVQRRNGPREAIPAAVRRAVWSRDQGRCAWPLDTGGRCGSTHRLELDHIQPRARGGEPTEANLRLICAAHNRLAARLAFGARCMERYAGGRSAQQEAP
jgi:5-methylcytosine-specific restriction endonuclease McrA